MRCGMNKPRSIKVRLYVALLIYLNEYLIFFPGANLSDKIGITELIFLTLFIIANLSKSMRKALIVNIFH